MLSQNIPFDCISSTSDISATTFSNLQQFFFLRGHGPSSDPKHHLKMCSHEAILRVAIGAGFWDVLNSLCGMAIELYEELPLLHTRQVQVTREPPAVKPSGCLTWFIVLMWRYVMQPLPCPLCC
jgi:hypothetical protein